MTNPRSSFISDTPNQHQPCTRRGHVRNVPAQLRGDTNTEPPGKFDDAGPNTAEVLAFLDVLQTLTAEQYVHLDAAFDRDGMDRWQAGANADVKP